MLSSADVVLSSVGVVVLASITLSVATMDNGRLRGLSEFSGLRAHDKGELREGIASEGESLICEVRLKSGIELVAISSTSLSMTLPRRDSKD